jgi:primosomal protein N' (replication factor Y)
LQQVANIAVQGPGPAIVPRVRNQFIYEIWIKCPRDNKMLSELKSFLKTQKQAILANKGNANVQIVFDVDPM